MRGSGRLPWSAEAGAEAPPKSLASTSHKAWETQSDSPFEEAHNVLHFAISPTAERRAASEERKGNTFWKSLVKARPPLHGSEPGRH